MNTTTGNATPQHLAQDNTAQITIHLTEQELEVFKVVNYYHKSLSLHDILAAEVYAQISALSNDTLRTVSFWNLRKRNTAQNNREDETTKFELSIHEKFYKLYLITSRLLNVELDYLIDNLLRDSAECSESYLKELTGGGKNILASEHLEEIGKAVLDYTAEERMNGYRKDQNGLNIWERLSLEHLRYSDKY